MLSLLNIHLWQVTNFGMQAMVADLPHPRTGGQCDPLQASAVEFPLDQFGVEPTEFRLSEGVVATAAADPPDGLPTTPATFTIFAKGK